MKKILENFDISVQGSLRKLIKLIEKINFNIKKKILIENLIKSIRDIQYSLNYLDKKSILLDSQLKESENKEVIRNKIDIEGMSSYIMDLTEKFKKNKQDLLKSKNTEENIPLLLIEDDELNNLIKALNIKLESKGENRGSEEGREGNLVVDNGSELETVEHEVVGISNNGENDSNNEKISDDENGSNAKNSNKELLEFAIFISDFGKECIQNLIVSKCPYKLASSCAKALDVRDETSISSLVPKIFNICYHQENKDEDNSIGNPKDYTFCYSMESLARDNHDLLVEKSVFENGTVLKNYMLNLEIQLTDSTTDNRIKFIHGDFKPDNVMRSRKSYRSSDKFIDFGFANLICSTINGREIKIKSRPDVIRDILITREEKNDNTFNITNDVFQKLMIIYHTYSLDFEVISEEKEKYFREALAILLFAVNFSIPENLNTTVEINCQKNDQVFLEVIEISKKESFYQKNIDKEIADYKKILLQQDIDITDYIDDNSWSSTYVVLAKYFANDILLKPKNFRKVLDNIMFFLEELDKLDKLEKNSRGIVKNIIDKIVTTSMSGGKLKRTKRNKKLKRKLKATKRNTIISW